MKAPAELATQRMAAQDARTPPEGKVNPPPLPAREPQKLKPLAKRHFGQRLGRCKKPAFEA